MIHLIYGPDGYRIDRRVAQLATGFLKTHPQAGVFVFDLLEDDSLDKLKDAIVATSLFDPARIVKIKHVFSARRTKELVELLDSSSLGQDVQTLTLVYETLSGDNYEKKTEAMSAIAGLEKEDMQKLQGQALNTWIKREFSDRDTDVEADALRVLVELAGSDSGPLVNEINKLCNYAQGEKIDEAMVKLLVVPLLGLNVFDLVDALAQRNKAKAIDLLFRELSSGKDPYEVLPPITYQFRNLVTARDLLDRKFPQAQISKLLGVHPFVARKTLAQVEEFTIDELRQVYGMILSFDIGAKKGTIYLGDELYRLIF